MSRRAERPAYVVTGRVIKPYGVLGWVKAENLSSNPRRFRAGASFLLDGGGEERLVLEEAREGHGGLLLKFRGVEDREGAGELAGRRLMVPAQELGEPPPQAYWEHEVMGLEVHTREGDYIGVVAEVMETGANDVLVVEKDTGGEVLIPMTAEVVTLIDLEAGRMIIDPLPGLLEE